MCGSNSLYHQHLQRYNNRNHQKITSIQISSIRNCSHSPLFSLPVLLIASWGGRRFIISLTFTAVDALVRVRRKTGPHIIKGALGKTRKSEANSIKVRGWVKERETDNGTIHSNRDVQFP